jgi:hypothetical protein
MKHLVLTALALAALAVPVVAQTVVAPRGTQFQATLDQELNTKTLQNGTAFTLTEHDGFFHKAPPVLKGAHIDGHVENVTPAHTGHSATLALFFDDIVLVDGERLPIDAKVTSTKALEPKKHLFRDTGLIIGGAVVGHMAASKAGLQHGGLTGAVAGFALATNLKSDIVVKRGTIVNLKLNHDLVETPH